MSLIKTLIIKIIMMMIMLIYSNYDYNSFTIIMTLILMPIITLSNIIITVTVMIAMFSNETKKSLTPARTVTTTRKSTVRKRNLGHILACNESCAAAWPF